MWRFFYCSTYNIMWIMLFAADFGGFFIFMLNYQVHIFHTLTVFIASGDNINSCGVDAAVTENVSELGNILFDTIEGSCEKVAQIMGKYLLWIYPCLLTKAFHFTPNVGSAHWLAISSYEYRTRSNLLLCCIAEQFLLQFSYNKYRACFAF